MFGRKTRTPLHIIFNEQEDGKFDSFDVTPVYKIELSEGVTKYYTRDKLRRATKFRVAKKATHRYKLRIKNK